MATHKVTTQSNLMDDPIDALSMVIRDQHATAQWSMELGERFALWGLLQAIRPQCAIEVGTFRGGSLEVIAEASDHVFSLDCNPDHHRDLEGRFPNVDFITGHSHRTLPPLIEHLQTQRTDLDFVLVDGSHATDAVVRDITNMLAFTPLRRDLHVVMHDSLMPSVRSAFRQVDWHGYPHVHAVEFDFVTGILHSAGTVPRLRGRLCGGLALAVVRPFPRSGALILSRRNEGLFQAGQWSSRLQLWSRTTGLLRRVRKRFQRTSYAR